MILQGWQRPRPRSALVHGLAEVAGRLSPAEAAEPAQVLNQALAQEKVAYTRWVLVHGLAAVAGRLDPAEAARACAEPTRLLSEALEKRNAQAMRTVFADTFYFLALLNATDNAHAKAVAFTASFQGRLVTTGWVMTELADALAFTPQGRADL